MKKRPNLFSGARGEQCKCDCSAHCGDDPRVKAGRMPMCEHGQKLAAERRKLLAKQAEKAEIIAIHDKLHEGKLGMHWLWVVISEIAAGRSEEDALRGMGYELTRRPVPPDVSEYSKPDRAPHEDGYRG